MKSDDSICYQIAKEFVKRYEQAVNSTPVTPSKDDGNKNICLPETKCNLCGMMGNPPWNHHCPDGIPDYPVNPTKLKHKHSNVYITPVHSQEPKVCEERINHPLPIILPGGAEWKSQTVCNKPLPCPIHPPQPKPRWKPQEFGSYWFVNTKGQVHKTQKTFKNDLEVIAFGNCFPTREKAEEAAQAIRDLLMKIQGE